MKLLTSSASQQKRPLKRPSNDEMVIYRPSEMYQNIKSFAWQKLMKLLVSLASQRLHALTPSDFKRPSDDIIVLGL